MVNLFPGVPAYCLCDKHLNSVLSEYTNLLMPSIRKGKSIKGYIQHGCVDLPATYIRILGCLAEAKKRGKKWKYPVPSEADVTLLIEMEDKYGEISEMSYDRRKEMAEMNKRILAFRCPECRKRIMGAGV